MTLSPLLNSQSQRVLWLLEELQIPFTLVTHIRDPTTLLATASLIDATPLGKAPTLITAGGDPIVESSAIIGPSLSFHSLLPIAYPLPLTAYLIRTYDHAHQFQGAGLIGHDVRDEVLTSSSSSTFQPWNTVKLFVELGALTDNTHGHLIEPRVASSLEYLEHELGDQDYFMGASPGRPDFMLSWPIDTIVQRRTGELGPKLSEWRERVLSREGWKSAIEKAGVPYDLAALKL